MSDSKISALPAAASLVGTELIPLDQAGNTVQTPVSNLLSRANSNVYLSAYPGVDSTGVTDSFAAVAAAIASVANTNKTLVWDCPAFLQVGTDLTKTIFVAGNTSIDFTAAGVLITDSLGIPVIAHVCAGNSNVTMEDFTLRYIGNPGATMLQYTGTWATNNGNWNTITLTNYLAANNGNTFTGGATAIWPSPTNSCALIYFGGGVSNINYIGSVTITAAFSTADRFIPTLFALNIQWKANQTIPSGLVQNATTAAQPANISFDGVTVDGVCMGWVGTGSNVKLRNITSLRYGDLEDSSGNNQGGIGTNSGRSGNLANDLWFAPPHLFYLQSNNSAFVCSVDYLNILDQGIYTSNNPNYGSRRTSGSGYINMMKVDASSLNTLVNIICKRPDGFCDVLAQVGGSIVPGCMMDGVDIFMDCGIGATVTTVNAGSLPATTTSFTVLPANWVCNQLGGTYAGIASGTFTTQFSSGEVRSVTYTVTVVSGNATAISASWTQPLLNANTNVVRIGPASGGAVGGRFAFRWPGQPATNFWLNNIKIVDQATFPLMWPMQSDASVGHVNIFMRYDLIVQDWPTIANYNPGFGLTGEGIDIIGKTILTNCSATQNFRGPIVNNSGTLTLDHFREEVLHGWRQTLITFAVAPTGTSGNILSAMWPLGTVGWIYPSGTYNVIFSDGEVRPVTFTNGSVACSWSVALTGTPTVTAQACLINAAQFNAFRPRIQLAQVGAPVLINYGVRARVIDVSNGGEINLNQGMMEELWWQYFQGIPSGSTGITYDATWAIDRAAWGVLAALSGGTATAVNLTTGGNTILSNGAVTSPGPLPIVGPQPYAGVITVAPVSGSLPSAGTAYVGVRGVRSGLSTN